MKEGAGYEKKKHQDSTEGTTNNGVAQDEVEPTIRQVMAFFEDGVTLIFDTCNAACRGKIRARSTVRHTFLLLFSLSRDSCAWNAHVMEILCTVAMDER